MVQLIRAACNFLVSQHGSRPKLEHRRSLAEKIHALIPRLKTEMIFSKLTQRMINLERLAKLKKSRIKTKARESEIIENMDGNDYEDLLEAHKIRSLDQDNDECDVDDSCIAEYLEIEKVEDTAEPLYVTTNETDTLYII